jgi:hypothetical protein
MGNRTPIPLLATTYKKANLTVGSTQELVNMYLEAIPNTTNSGGPTLACIGTPGLSSYINLGGSSVRSLIEHQGTGFAVVGNGVIAGTSTVYSINPTTLVATSLGTITTSATGHLSVAAIDTDIVWADGTKVYNWNGSAFSDITATLSLGATVNYVVAKDGFMTYMVNSGNKVFISNVEAVSTVNPTSFFTLSANYDASVSAITSDYFIYFFSQRSTEIWYDAGANVVPFSRITGGVLQIGIVAQYSAACINENVYMLAQSPNGVLGIAMMNGPQYSIISSADFVNKVNSYNSISDAFAWVSVHDGHTFYNITFPNASTFLSGITRGRTWMYDTTNGTMSERQSYNPNILSQDRHVTNARMFLNGLQIVGDFQSGNLYIESVNNYDDAGQIISNSITSPPLVDRNTRFSLTNAQVDMEGGQGLDGSGPSSPPLLILQVSKDRGTSYGNNLVRTVPAIGDHKTRIRFGSLGSSYDFRFRILLSGAYKKVIYGMTAEVDAEENSYARAAGLQ